MEVRAGDEVQGGRRGGLSPILAAQALDAIELAAIAGDDNEAAAAGMPGDQHVVSADRPTLALERCPDVAGVGRRLRIKGQDLEARSEILHLPPVGARPR